MARSLKKGYFIDDHLLRKVDAATSGGPRARDSVADDPPCWPWWLTRRLPRPSDSCDGRVAPHTRSPRTGI